MPMSKEDVDKSSLTDDEKEDLEQQEPTPVIRVHERSKWQRVPFTSTKLPPPPKASLDDADLIPEATASFFSLLTFGWITSLLGLGYARPLEATDLYKLQDSRAAATIAEKINASYARRAKEAKEFNERLAAGKIGPGWRSILWTLKAWFLRSTTVSNGGMLKVISDTAQITSPLVVKAIIDFGTESYAGRHSGSNPIPPVGKGIGLVFCLLIMQTSASFCTHHFFYRSASTGVLTRAGLITAIYTRSLRLTTWARSSLPNGKLVNFISTDVSRVDFCCGYFHMSWTSPIQMAICLILLLINLGPSALAGFGFFVLVTPIQVRAMKMLFASQKKAMFFTDLRAKLLQELLGGIKIIKFFAWENSFLARIMEYREREINYMRNILIIRAANNAVALSMPTLASVISFVIYSASGHPLDPGIVFTSLSLFNLLRLPLMLLPMSLGMIVDAAQAITRLNDIFEAQSLEDSRVIDHNLDAALRIEDASFTWEAHCAITLQLLCEYDLVEVVWSSILWAELIWICFENVQFRDALKRSYLVASDAETKWDPVTTPGKVSEEGESATHGAVNQFNLDSVVEDEGSNLSIGQRSLVSLARAIVKNSKIIILDEATALVDYETDRNIIAYEFKDRTILCIAHRLRAIISCDRIYVLDAGQVAEFDTAENLFKNDKGIFRGMCERSGITLDDIKLAKRVTQN